MYSLSLFLALVLCQHCAVSNGLEAVQSPLQKQPTLSSFEEANISLPTDHFNASDSRTFANRFWFNATFYKPGGPIFFYDAGESGVLDRTLTSLSSAKHPLMSITKTFEGLAIVWEHRYYGLSSPFPDLIQGTQAEREEAYRCLNTELALEDAVFFALHFEPPGLEDLWEALKPNATPWIWIGGSYPGQRGAMIRRRNPDVFFASWSSSANVEVRTSLPEYYLHISHDLPRRCGDLVRQGVRYIDGVLRTGSRPAKVQLRWAIARRWPSEKANFLDRAMFALAAPDFIVGNHLQGLLAADWQYYGVKGRMGTTCAFLSATHPNFTTDPGAAMELMLDAIEANSRHFASHNEARQRFPLDGESWEYQVCTEYFELRTAAPGDPYNVLSSVLTTENIWTNTCAQRFPWLTQPWDLKHMSPTVYAGWDKNSSNVMFTTGMRDPWHEASMVPSKGFIPGAPSHRKMTEEVPLCNEVLTGDQVFGIVFEKGRHCSDLMPGSENAQRSVDLFVKALKVWLPSFSPKSA